MKQEDFNELFRNRTKRLALEIIRITSVLTFIDGMSIIRKQLIRSVTSVAANYKQFAGQDLNGKDLPNFA